MTTPQQQLEELIASQRLTIERNIVSCNVQIASLTGRVLTIEYSGEDETDLQKRLDGYEAKRDELKAELATLPAVQAKTAEGETTD